MPYRCASSVVCLLMTFLIVPDGRAAAQTTMPATGSWKLNIAKSKLGSEQPPRSMTSTVEIVGEHTKVTGIRIDPDGYRTEVRYTAKVDGKDYPMTGSHVADTIALRRIDTHTIERIDKKAGKIVESSITVFSSDGKTSTTTGKAKNSVGIDFHFTIVNEKQP